jgi:5'-phosphate synthase pdxT subunit
LSTIGVLAVQGDFLEHRQALHRLGACSSEVRLPDQLEPIDGLIIPGGESTTIVHLIDTYELRDTLRRRVQSGMPVWGTCAGMIVLADRLSDSRPEPLHLMDIEVSRNGFGRQVDSFEADLEIEQVEGPPFRAVFIRAPVVDGVGEDVRVLATVNGGRPVAVRQGRMLATSFHPELTDDDRVHQLFLNIVEGTC